MWSLLGAFDGGLDRLLDPADDLDGLDLGGVGGWSGQIAGKLLPGVAGMVGGIGQDVPNLAIGSGHAQPHMAGGVVALLAELPLLLIAAQVVYIGTLPTEPLLLAAAQVVRVSTGFDHDGDLGGGRAAEIAGRVGRGVGNSGLKVVVTAEVDPSRLVLEIGGGHLARALRRVGLGDRRLGQGRRARRLDQLRGAGREVHGGRDAQVHLMWLPAHGNFSYVLSLHIFA